MIHVENGIDISEEAYYRALRKTMDSRYPCDAHNCPASILEQEGFSFGQVCRIGTELNDFCKEAVGVPVNGPCPCNALGRRVAILRAEKLLEDIGY